MLSQHDIKFLKYLASVFRGWNMHEVANPLDHVAAGTATDEQWQTVYTILKRILSPSDPEAAFWLEELSEIDAKLRQQPEQLTLF